jgi:protein-disulfide isomerase
MKFFAIIFSLIIFSLSVFGQISEQVLAVANGQKFAVKDLPANVREQYTKLSATVAATRKELLSLQIVESLLEQEAAARKISVEALREKEIKAKVPNPKDNEIESVYNANREAIGNKTLGQVRFQIVNFLRAEPEQKLLIALVNRLKVKYKPTIFKDVNAVNLKPADVLARIGTKTITAKNFEEKNKVAIYETKAKVFDLVKFALNQMIFSALVAAEAKVQNVEPGVLIAQEITDKMREFSEEERDTLETDFRKRLFVKYKTQILLKEPAPIALNITTAGNPAKGNENATVTVVMFSDFQCSACAATHPVLQKVLTEYGEKVRFVVRYFPLVNAHENAFQAALAAESANLQGKFFEYTEILYRNQDALDNESLKKYAADAGLNLEQFALDLQSEKVAARVRQDMTDGRSYGIAGTPSIYVNGIKVRVLSADGFREAIDKALR